jgi:PAS domain S-box-containing protein
MSFDLNVFSFTLLLGGAITLLVSALIFQRIGGTVKWFGYLMLGISIWALSYGIELSCTNLEQILFCIKIEYFGISLLPALWFVFIVKFVGNDKWLTPLNLILIFFDPILTIFFALTLQWNHLLYANVALDTGGPFPLLAITPGLWYKIHTVYFYTMLAWGVLLLLYRFRKADAIYKKHNAIIIAGACIPWVVNFFYLLDIRPLKHIDLTPYAFIITAWVISLGLLRFGLFDIIPIARGKVIEAMSDGVVVIDVQNRIVDINSQMKKILLLEGRKVIGSGFEKFLPNNEALYRIIEQREAAKIDIDLWVEKSMQHFTITLTPLFEKRTVFSGFVLIFRNITIRKSAEEQLVKQAEELASLNKLKDKLFSIIAHDIKTPVANLTQSLSLINSGHISEKDFVSFLPSLLKNSQYTAELLDNLLHWSKSQLHGQKLNPTIFNLNEITRSEINLFERRATEKSVSVINNVPSGLSVFADAVMIALVIRNLISNALKFSNKNGIISIAATVTGSMTVVCVSDNGVGISENNLDKLFGSENFSTRGIDNEQGTGLGLLLCKDFVELNKGKIWVESEMMKGSRFYFSIPNSPSESYQSSFFP